MAAPTLVDLPSAEVKRRYAALSDEDKTRATTLKRNGRTPAEAVQIIEAQNAAYMGQQPAAEQARARGDVKEAKLREAAAAALGAGQALSMGADKAVMDAWQWAKKHPVAAAYTAPFLPAAAALGLLGEDDAYRQQVEKIQQDAPGAAQRGMATAMIGELLTGGGAAKQMGKAALEKLTEKGGSAAMRLIRAGARPGAEGAAGGFVAGASNASGGPAERIEAGAEGAAMGGGLGFGLGALPTAATMTIRPKRAPSAPSAGPGVGAGLERAAELYGKAGNIPVIGKMLPGSKAAGAVVDAIRLARKAQAPAVPAPVAPSPAAAPAGPKPMPAPPREARAVPIPEPAPIGVTPEMIVESAPTTAIRVRKLGEENPWVANALKHGVSPEQIAKGSGLPVEDVQALARARRTDPNAGPVAADAPPPAPAPEAPAPSPFARAKPPGAQPAEPPAPRPPVEPTAENVPPGVSPERWRQLVEHYGKKPEPFLSSPTPRPTAGPQESTAVGRTPKPPPEPAAEGPSPLKIRDASIEKFDAVRRARQALRGTAEVMGEQSPKWLNAVLDEIRTNPNIRPEEIRRVTDRMIAEGHDPHLIQQAIAARRGQELEGLADLSRLTGKTMKENLVAQAIASGAKTADDIAEMTGLNLSEVELLTGRHDVLVPRGVPKPEPASPTPINPAPIDESGQRVFAPAYKEIFGEPYRASRMTAEERLGRLPPGVGEADMRKVLELRAKGITDDKGGKIADIAPLQIAKMTGLPPPVVRFILKERGQKMPSFGVREGPEPAAFDEGAKVMGRGAEGGNIARIKLLLDDKAGLAKFLGDLRNAGWTEAQIDGMMSQATKAKPLRVRKKRTE